MNTLSMYINNKKIVIYAETSAKYKILKYYKRTDENLKKALKHLKGLEKNDYYKTTIFKVI